LVAEVLGGISRTCGATSSLAARTSSTVIRQHGGPFALRADYGSAENLPSTRTCLELGQSDRHWRDQRRAGVLCNDL